MVELLYMVALGYFVFGLILSFHTFGHIAPGYLKSLGYAIVIVFGWAIFFKVGLRNNDIVLVIRFDKGA